MTRRKQPKRLRDDRPLMVIAAIVGVLLTAMFIWMTA
jgi:hypothetical protein